MSKIETKLIHSGREYNETKAVITPIYQTSTYLADPNPEEYIKSASTANYPYFYHRHGNPSNSQVSATLAALEQTEDAMVLATGMAAISTAVIAAVKSGDHIVAQTSHYSGTSLLFESLLPKFGVEITRVEQHKTQEIIDAIKPSTSLIYLETPSNPNLAITDLQAIARVAKEKNITTMVDNTFASPINQKPKSLGIDIILHSASKYLGGHSDLTAGVICGSKAFINKAWKTRLILGGNLAPMDSFLLARGLKTLKLRMEQINATSLSIAKFLENQNQIEDTLYPGLPSHPQHELASQQMAGFGGVVSIILKSKTSKDALIKAQQFLSSLKIFTNAASIGGVESLVVHPASMFGKHQENTSSSVPAGLVRLSIGLEHPDDLMEDLKNALEAIK